VGPDIEVPIIEDLKQRFIIDSLAVYVQRDGCAFEQVGSVHALTSLLHSLQLHCFGSGIPEDQSTQYAAPVVQLVMEAEQSNPEYAFLFDLTCPEHIYYRWVCGWMRPATLGPPGCPASIMQLPTHQLGGKCSHLP
jgi:hypothetical protein